MVMELLGGLGRIVLVVFLLKFIVEDLGICLVVFNEMGFIGIIGIVMEDWVIRKGLKGGLFLLK